MWSGDKTISVMSNMSVPWLVNEELLYRLKIAT